MPQEYDARLRDKHGDDQWDQVIFELINTIGVDALDVEHMWLRYVHMLMNVLQQRREREREAVQAAATKSGDSKYPTCVNVVLLNRH